MNKILVLLLSGLMLTGCQSIQNKAEGFADKISRYAIERNVGKNYKEVAAQRDWSIQRKLVIGKPIANKKLANGKHIYFHELRQESANSANLFGVVSLGDKHVRYDFYAFLVSKQGVILDYAHKRSNTKYSHLGTTGFVALEIAGDEEANKELKQIDKFVTSKGKSIKSWK